MSVRLAEINVGVYRACPIVSAGVHGLLSGHPEFRVSSSAVFDPMRLDLLLYEPNPNLLVAGAEIRELAPHVGSVVGYTWAFDAAEAEACLDAGARGYVSARLDGDGLATALRNVFEGHTTVADVESARIQPSARRAEAGARSPDIPLSGREQQVLSLIVAGKMNHEIAAELFLSINSVKSYVRSAYRKIQVERRSQAVRWAFEHGLPAAA